MIRLYLTHRLPIDGPVLRLLRPNSLAVHLGRRLTSRRVAPVTLREWKTLAVRFAEAGIEVYILAEEGLH